MAGDIAVTSISRVRLQVRAAAAVLLVAVLLCVSGRLEYEQTVSHNHSRIRLMTPRSRVSFPGLRTSRWARRGLFPSRCRLTMRTHPGSVTGFASGQSNRMEINAGNSSQTFESLGVPPYLVHRLNAMAIYHPTRVQAASIPLCLGNALDKPDLILEEKTGQGKTLAYLLPIVSEVDNVDESLQAVILVPSTTLARQVMRVLLQLTKGGKRKRRDYPIKSELVVSRPDQSYLAEFEEDPPHLVVGIPSAVDVLLRDSFGVSIEKIKYFVLDEVDKMISIERERLAIEKLAQEFKSKANPQCLLVSASMTKDSLALSQMYMPKVKRVSTLGVRSQSNEKQQKSRRKNNMAGANDTEARLPTRIRNYFIAFGDRKPTLRAKGDMLARLYRALEEAKFEGKRRRGSRPGLLVFVRNPANIGPLIDQLRGQYRLEVRGIDQRTNKRQLKQAIELMAAGRLQILIGTEILARGMDVEGVTDVVNLDVPKTSNAYLHRAGRAGRLQGKLASSSSVFTFITDDQLSEIEKISANLRVNINKASISKTQRLVVSSPDAGGDDVPH